MVKAGATLLGLSFASIAFAYGSLHSLTMPPDLIYRMVPFLTWTFRCAFAFLFCCALSFCALAFTDMDSVARKALGYVCICIFAVGITFLGFALFSLVKISVEVSVIF
jgi:hypothetical protein